VKQKSEAPKDPKLLNPAIPDNLSDLILKCLEKDKQKRCQSAAEVRSELENVDHGIQPTTRVVPIRKTTSKEITVSFNIRKMAIPVILIAAVALAAVLVWKPWAKKPSAPALSDKPSLAIMYFKNNTGDEKLDHWRMAISDLLVTDLSQSRYIKILSSDQLFDILSEMNQADAKSYTSKVLKDVAGRGGVKDILVGSFARAGDNFRIDVTLQVAATGELISSERVEGKGEDGIFSMVDELTRKIKADLKLSTEEIASDIDEELEKITTSSVEAFKFYIQGRMLHNEQKCRESIRMMEEAVAIDPGFAMAYRSMAMSFSNLTLTSEKQRCLTKAFELSSRLSDRERYIIEADYYRESERLYDKAVAAYEKLLELYPDDNMGNTNLGILYNTLEEWDKAIELYELRIRNNPEDPWAYFNILDSYLAKGWPEKAEAALEGYVENYNENFMFRIYLAFVDLVQGRYDRALVEAEKADSLNPGFYWNPIAKGCAYRGLGDWGKAEAEYQKALDLEEKAGHLVARRMLGAMSQLRGQFKRAEEEMVEGAQIAGNIGDQGWISDFHQSLAYIFLGSGRPERALEEATQSLRTAREIDSLSRQKRVLLAKGYAEIESGRAGDAKKTAEALRALIDQDVNKKDIRYPDLLMGKVMLNEGDYAGAIGRLIKAEELLPFEYFFDNDQVLFMDALARAYFEQGDLDKARAGYEKITRLTIGAFYYGDIYARSFLMLGKIAERQGDKIKASENYAKFLDLWKDADPGLPEVEDAGKRLAGLKRQ
jgi:tetratricopeptide (TPR) repeat protein